MYLAQKLGRTLREVRAMGHDEFVLWTRYYALLQQEQELEAAKHG